ncbi:MAG: hypothetical protein JNM99_17410 [Verrucomicrobiaceae bacterium]|nr:hypothetical protein [Verrucomicrobiaceae bacterium]
MTRPRLITVALAYRKLTLSAAQRSRDNPPPVQIVKRLNNPGEVIAAQWKNNLIPLSQRL